MSLSDLPVISWIRLLIGMVIFLGPGYLICSIHAVEQYCDSKYKIILSFALSLSCWAILLSITNLAGISLQPAIAIAFFSVCGIFGLILNKPWQQWRTPRQNRKIDFAGLIFAILLSILFAISIWGVRNEVAGLGSDSYHHTFFTQMIIDQGRLPGDYGPFYPILTFTYHYGFHAAAAVLGWISGIPTPLLVLIFGKILILFCAIGAAYLGEQLTGNRITGMIAAVCTAGVFIFPSYLLNWGRYPQITGLFMLSFFLGYFWNWIKRGMDWPGVALLAVLGTGIGLTHYRIVLMAIIGCLSITMTLGIDRISDKKWLGQILKRGGALVILTLIGFSAWLVNLVQASETGYAVQSTQVRQLLFSVSRIGDVALHYPTNNPALVLLGVSILIGLIKRERAIIALTLWSLLMLILSPIKAFMDTVSVVISLYIPVGVIIGWGICFMIESIVKLKDRVEPIRDGIVSGILILFAAYGIYIGSSLTNVRDRYLLKTDFPSLQYIQENIPEDAYFMVNLYRFPLSDTLMVSPDAGNWLPLLADRRTVLAPMVFMIERVDDPDYALRLRELEALNGNLTTPEGIDLLKAVGITHVYGCIGRGSINPDDLAKSSSFRLIYNDGYAFIYEVVY
jgi:hypothetical protein